LGPMSRRGYFLYFFLTPTEQVALLEDFEARHQVAYYRTDTSSVPEAPAIASLVSEQSFRHLAIGISPPVACSPFPRRELWSGKSRCARGAMSMPWTKAKIPRSRACGPAESLRQVFWWQVHWRRSRVVLTLGYCFRHPASS
jgi:hypothetical protein